MGVSTRLFCCLELEVKYTDILSNKSHDNKCVNHAKSYKFEKAFEKFS